MQVPSSSRLYPSSVIAELAGLQAPPEDWAAMMSAANFVLVADEVPMTEPLPPVLLVIVEASTVRCPRLENAPPKPGVTLPAIVELATVTVPAGWTLIPPPLVGAVLLVSAERSTVVVPTLRIAPP